MLLRGRGFALDKGEQTAIVGFSNDRVQYDCLITSVYTFDIEICLFAGN